jgi:hypothetical protein
MRMNGDFGNCRPLSNCLLGIELHFGWGLSYLSPKLPETSERRVTMPRHDFAAINIDKEMTIY